MQVIKISQILSHPDVIKVLPCGIQNKENIPLVTYQLDDIIRNLLLN